MRALLLTILLGGCASRSPVRTEHPTGHQEADAGTSVLVLEAALRPDEHVSAEVVRRVPFDVYDLIEVRTGRRYTPADVKRPTLSWGGAAVGTAAVGGLAYWAEGSQLVERGTIESGTTADYPKTGFQSVEADNRATSTALLYTAAGLGTVALSQLAARVLPTTDRDKQTTRSFVDRRWEQAPADGVGVTLWQGDSEVGQGRTDADGVLLVSLSALSEPAIWAWELRVSVPGDEVVLDLRASPMMGERAGAQASRLVASGAVSASRAVLAPLAARHPANEPAWAAWCNAAAARIDSLGFPNEARVLLPGTVAPESCLHLRQALAARAATLGADAMRRDELVLARRWLPFLSPDQQARLQTRIDEAQDRIDAAEAAAERRDLQRQRASWKSRTSHALSTCAQTQREIARRKARVQRLARSGDVGAAQTEVERFQTWMEETGQHRLGGALEEIQNIHNEMQHQNVEESVMVLWMQRVAQECGER